jgi:hypothetical protein
VAPDPGGQIGLAGLHVAQLDGVALKQVGDDGQVAIVGELVGEELAVVVDADDVGEEDDCLFGGLIVLGIDDVSVNWDGSQYVWLRRRICYLAAYHRRCSSSRRRECLRV